MQKNVYICFLDYIKASDNVKHKILIEMLELLDIDTGVTNLCGVNIGCVNARSTSNKTAALCRSIIDKQLDVMVITETWHEHSASTTLKRVCPLGYHYIDAARPILPDVPVDTVDFQNHGGLSLFTGALSVF